MRRAAHVILSVYVALAGMPMPLHAAVGSGAFGGAAVGTSVQPGHAAGFTPLPAGSLRQSSDAAQIAPEGLRPADPVVWGINAGALEVVSKRVRDAKHFLNPDGSYTAVFGKFLHYEIAPGVWADVDLNFRAQGDEYVMDQHIINARVSANGMAVFERSSGKGIRWLTPERPVVSGRRVRFSSQGLSWEYATRKSGVKLLASVAASRGPTTYVFSYRLLGGASPLAVDVNGDLVSDRFRVPRAYAQGADHHIYHAGPWQLLPGNQVAFQFNDAGLPASTFPYELDPTTTFSAAVSADDGYVYKAWSVYSGWPPGGAATVSTTNQVIYLSKSINLNYEYEIWNSLVRWDTSSIGNARNVTGATLRAYQTYAIWNGNGRSLTAEWYDGSANWPIDAADYSATAQSTALSIPISSVQPDSNDFALTNASSNISKTSYTGLRLHVSDGAAPSSLNAVGFASVDDVTYAEPRLLVTYNPIVTLGSNIKVTTMTLGSGATLDLGSSTLTLSGSGTGASKPLSVSGALYGATSTIEYAGASATDVTALTYPGSLKINGPDVLTGATIATADVTVASGSLSLNAQNLTVIGGDFDVAVAGTVYCGNGNNTCAAGTVTMKGTSGTTGTGLGGAGATTLYNLTVGDGGTTTTAVDLAGTVAVNKDISVTANSSLSLNGKDITSAAAVTGSFTSSGTVYCGNGDNTCSAGTLTCNSTNNLGGGSFTVYNLTLADLWAYPTTTLAGPMTVKGDVNILESGGGQVWFGHQLDVSASNYQITAEGNWIDNVSAVGNGGLIARNGTILMLGSGKTVRSDPNYAPFYNLTIGNGTSSASITAASNLSITGDLTIAASSGTNSFNASDKTITLAGTDGTPFNINGETFTPSTSTIIYTGNNAGGNTTVNATTYNNLQLNNAAETYVLGNTTCNGDFTAIAAGQPIQLTAGTTLNVAGALTLTGAAGSLIVLRSGTSGTQWNLSATGTKAVSYVDVQDSNACPNTVTSTFSLNSGNNDCWNIRANGITSPTGSGTSSYPSIY